MPAHDDPTNYGWSPHFQLQLASMDGESIRPARVIGVHRSVVELVAPDLATSLPIPLNLENGPLAVGDWVLLDEAGERIVHLLERTSLFRRRAPGTDRREQLIAANVDTLFIVSSCNQDFNEARLERYLAIGRDAGAMSIIVLTKADLCDDSSGYVRRAAALAPGLLAEAVNALDIESLRGLESWLSAGQTVALLGSSGVGKSTLTNTLLGGRHAGHARAAAHRRAGGDRRCVCRNHCARRELSLCRLQPRRRTRLCSARSSQARRHRRTTSGQLAKAGSGGGTKQAKSRGKACQ